MYYFERVDRAANFMFGGAAFCLLCAIIAGFASDFSEIVYYNYTNDLRGTVYLIVFIALTLVFLVLGIVLKTAVREANEDFRTLEERIKRLEDR